MKIADITCQDCGALYQVAEAESVQGSSGQASCSFCGSTLARWDHGTLKAFRLVIPPTTNTQSPQFLPRR